MNDEGVGIAGWLLADLALVLAIVFLAFTPAALSSDPEPLDPTPTPTAEPTVAPPVILDIGCTATERADRSMAVQCKPSVGGGAVATYHWKAERGSRGASTRNQMFVATFDEAGAVRLTVSNDGGEHTAAFPVLPSPVSVELPEPGLVLADFTFDQIIFCGAELHRVTWEQIASGRVRIDLSKEDELKGEWCSDDQHGEPALRYLRRKLEGGFRIALVETFSNLNGQLVTDLSVEVNNRFHDGLLEAAREDWEPGADTGDLFADCEPRDKWFASYFSTKALGHGEVRINLFFVKPSREKPCP